MRTYAPAEPGAVLAALLSEPSIARGVVHHAVLPAREAEHGAFPPWLDDRIVAGLAGRGIERPYVHQAEAIETARAGEDFVVVTPTASGKTLWLRAADPAGDRRRPGRTGAPAVPDQGPRAGPGHRVRRARPGSRAGRLGSTYDGDTPAPIRSAIRGAGQVVATNPDMLHPAILPHHTKWFQLFEHLRYIVIDELHTYRGVFGGHVANVLRRLRRICAHYGSQPVILCGSATIGNPGELAEALIGRPGPRPRPQWGASRRAPRPARRSPAPRPRQRRAWVRDGSRSRSAGRSRSCGPGGRPSCSAARGSPWSCC